MSIAAHLWNLSEAAAAGGADGHLGRYLRGVLATTAEMVRMSADRGAADLAASYAAMGVTAARMLGLYSEATE